MCNMSAILFLYTDSWDHLCSYLSLLGTIHKSFLGQSVWVGLDDSWWEGVPRFCQNREGGGVPRMYQNPEENFCVYFIQCI